MPESVEKEYRLAQKASKLGAGCMYCFAALSIVPLALLCTTVFLYGSHSSDEAIPLLSSSIGHLATSASIALLGNFLRCFGHSPSPFGKQQSHRLIASSVLLGLRTFLDASFIVPPAELHLTDNAHFLVSATAGPDLKVIVMIVFLICLAMVVRYGDALKEDSDSIA